MCFILTDAKILSMRTKAFEAHDSILIEDGKIKALGSVKQCKSQAHKTAQTISINGKVILPALCDAHTHFVELAKGRFQLRLDGISSIQGIKDAILKYRKTNPLLPDWVLGDAWDINLLDAPSALNRELLDELFPDRPVALFSKDYHAKWCNSQALKIAGLLEPKQHSFGSDLVKLGSDGLASGLIYEDATLYLEKFYTPVQPQILQKAIREELKHLASFGIVAFHFMEGPLAAQALQDAQAQGSQFRCIWHFPLDMLDEMIQKQTKSYQYHDSFMIGGVKLFADGALGSQTAAMFEAYGSQDGNKGILRHSEAELDFLIGKAARAGIASTIHAIGDLAVHTVIKCLSKHQEATLLHRIEHLQSIRNIDLLLLKASKLACSVQPVHLANDIPMIQNFWQNSQDQAYRFGDLVQTGNPLAFGSDAPIETINPFAGIHAALSRKEANNPDNVSWHPEQRISAFEAIKAYTLGAAQLSKSEHTRGSLAPGKLADLCVVDDWQDQPDEFWLEQRSYLTMINGNIIHNEINT